MNAQDLRNSILQLAVQGKLVEQRPEEGTAKELLKQIRAEKEKLIKEKKVKKESNPSIILRGTNNLPYEQVGDEVRPLTVEAPFEIPDSWEWCRVGDLFTNMSGLSYKKDALAVEGERMIRVLRGGNIGEKQFSLKPDDVFIASEFVKPELFLRKNYMITPAVSSLDHIGKIALIDRDYDDTVVGGFVLMLIPFFADDMLSKYLLYAFSAYYHRNNCRNITHKSGQAFYNLSRELMMNLPVPIPPLAEQKRIVAKLEEILPYIEQYDKAHTKLEIFNKKFPEDMKKSVLQLAMQGRLVEQRPEEGTAEELYRQIAAEKARLIKEGKIKAEKPLPEIGEDEIPFEIPKSWKWVRLKDVCIKIIDGNHNPPRGVDVCTEYVMASSTNINNDEIVELDKVRYLTKEVFEKENERTKVAIGDIFFTSVGTLGRSCVYKGGYNICFQRSVSVIGTLLFNYYLKYALDSAYFQYKVKREATGTAQKGFYLNQLSAALIPVPPLAEQKRIVAKIEEILPYCEQLIK